MGAKHPIGTVKTIIKDMRRGEETEKARENVVTKERFEMGE